MIGELTRASCSMYGAWGDATENGKTLQLRALDWETAGPFQDFPQVTVYHPTSDFGVPFANVGWTGFIGSVTGMSSEGIAISEIGVTYPDDTFGKESRIGTPFTFLLRDVMQFQKTLDAIKSFIESAKRTCYLILGFGDGKVDTTDRANKPFNSLQYSTEVANFMDDETMLPQNETWHFKLDQMVYHGMDWLWYVVAPL